MSKDPSAKKGRCNYIIQARKCFAALRPNADPTRERLLIGNKETLVGLGT
jgi:hypothetical protein